MRKKNWNKRESVSKKGVCERERVWGGESVRYSEFQGFRS
jgi:hypothetical protein